MNEVKTTGSPQGGIVLRLLGLGDLAGSGFRSHLSFWSVILLTFFLFADQNLIASNMSRIGHDLGFYTKEEYLWYIGSVVSLFFFLLGGVVSIYAGILTDQCDRKKLMLTVVLLGEIPCGLTAFADNYAFFLAMRTLTGFGLGGILPLIFSLLGDYFRPENRATASAWVGLAMGLGIAIGQLFAGAVAHDTIMGLSGWRFSFIAMAAPSLPIVLIYYFFGRLPRREGHAAAPEESEATHKITVDDFKRIFKTRTNILVFLQGMPGTVPWALLFVYLVDYYETVKGFHVQQANLMVVAFGGTAILGGFIGGFIGKYLYLKKRKYLPVFGGLAIIAGSIPTFYVLNYNGSELTIPVLMSLAGGLLSTLAVPNVRAILLNTNIPENRGSVFALYNLTDDLGKGLGPFLIGLLLMMMPQGLAYNIAVSFWLLSGFIWFFMIPVYEKDEKAVQQYLNS